MEQNHPTSSRRLPQWKLTALWTLALLVGAYAARRCADQWEPLLEKAIRCEPGLFGALTVSLFPIALSVLPVFGCGRFWFWLACPLQAFLLGLAAGAVGMHWGPVAPLMAVLLLGSRMLSSAVVLLLCQRIEAGNTPQTVGLAALGAGVLTTCGELWMTAPLLTEIVNLQRG